MSFLHLSLLAGLGAVSIPLMLHLFGRSQPQLVDFPALRFVQQTTQEQSMSWQLRHMLLLLLRVLLLAGLALALARPRVHSAMLNNVLTVTALGGAAGLASLVAAVAVVSRRPRQVWLTAGLLAAALWVAAAGWGLRSLASGPAVPTADHSAPVAAVLIVDNGPSMDYRAGNTTRLEAARQMGDWILEQLPQDSRVAVLTEAPVGVLALDPTTAKSQLKIITPRGAHVDLPARVRTALELVLASELERKEIYVLTDLMAPAWSASSSELVDMLGQHREEVLLQIIDVGSEDRTNFRLGDPQLDLTTLPVGGEVVIDIEVYGPSSATGDAQTASPLSVELWQEQIDTRFPIIRDGRLQVAPHKVVDRQVAELTAGPSTQVSLRAGDLAAGAHNFTVVLDAADPLAIDNRRYVSVMAQSQLPTLIVAEDAAIGQNLQAIVDPTAVAPPETAQVTVDQVRYVQLGSVQMEQYAVICLYDPPPLTARVAQALDEHVRGGGGLLIILGPGLGNLPAAEGNPLLQLLPGQLSAVASRLPSDPSVFPEPVALSHPLFAPLGQAPQEVLWNLFPVFRNWTFAALAEDSVTLMRLSDGSAPLLVSQHRGRGQILTLTTPVPEFDTRQRELWNLLWSSDPLPAFAVLLGSFRTLSGASQERLNYQAGQAVSLANDSRSWPSRYDLMTPDAQLRRVAAADGILSLGAIDHSGIYRLRGQRDEAVVRSFSVNVASADTSLLRLEPAALDTHLGENNYRLARAKSEVESSVGQARFGRELYPLLMVLVAGLFLAEQAMSNRFYKIKFGR